VHELAWNEQVKPVRDGIYRYVHGGEQHAYNPGVVMQLQKAVEKDSWQDYRVFADIMTILNSVSYAVLLLFTSDYVKEHDPTQLSIVQMYLVSIFGFIAALIFDKWDTPMSLLSFNSLLFSAVLCTAFAFWMQATAQRFTSASHIALIFTMEPVFGAFTAWLLLGENLGFKGFVGGGFIVCAMLIAEFDFNALKARLQILAGHK
jgi:drug/metabolite transporter (DMT)-like permease